MLCCPVGLSLSSNDCVGCAGSWSFPCRDVGCCPTGTAECVTQSYHPPTYLNPLGCRVNYNSWVQRRQVSRVSPGGVIDIEPHCTSNGCNNPRTRCTPTRASFHCDACMPFFGPPGDCRMFTCPSGSRCLTLPANGTGIPATYETTPIQCDAGTWCPENTITPIACPTGYACSRGASALLQCPAGSICPEGSALPSPCPAGHVCPSIQMGEPIPCEKGTFNGDVGSSASECSGHCSVWSTTSGPAAVRCDALSPLSVGLICLLLVVALMVAVGMVFGVRKYRRVQVAAESKAQAEQEAASQRAAVAKAAKAQADAQWAATAAAAEQQRLLQHAAQCANMRSQVMVRLMRELELDVQQAVAIGVATDLSDASSQLEGTPSVPLSSSRAHLPAYCSFLHATFNSVLASAACEPVLSLLVSRPWLASPVDLHRFLCAGVRPLAISSFTAFCREHVHMASSPPIDSTYEDTDGHPGAQPQDDDRHQRAAVPVPPGSAIDALAAALAGEFTAFAQTWHLRTWQAVPIIPPAYALHPIGLPAIQASSMRYALPSMPVAVHVSTTE